MSQENVEIVQRIYANWREGTSARSFIAEDVEYVNPPDAVEPGVRIGRAAFRGIMDSYDDVTVEPERYIDAGDDVVVIARVRAKGRGSGFPINWHHGYVWTIRGGQAVRFRWFNRPKEALEAVGLSE